MASFSEATFMPLRGRTHCPRRGHLASVACGTAAAGKVPDVPLNQGQEQHRGKGQAVHAGEPQNPSQGTSGCPPRHNPTGKTLTRGCTAVTCRAPCACQEMKDHSLAGV